MATPVEWAWAAGLFEGEGCISLQRGRQSSVLLSLKMTDKDVVDRFARLMETTSRIYVYEGRKETHKTLYCWATAEVGSVERILHGLLPHFGERRSGRALEALARLAATRQRKAERDAKDLCGTPSGYQRHRRRGEETCLRCREAVRVCNLAHPPQRA